MTSDPAIPAEFMGLSAQGVERLRRESAVAQGRRHRVAPLGEPDAAALARA